MRVSPQPSVGSGKIFRCSFTQPTFKPCLFLHFSLKPMSWINRLVASGPNDRYTTPTKDVCRKCSVVFLTLWLHTNWHHAHIEKVSNGFFQTLFSKLQQVISNDKSIRQPSVIIEETIEEDAIFPEQVAQEVVIKDDTVTHIGAGPYNGFIQVSEIKIHYINRIATEQASY